MAMDQSALLEMIEVLNNSDGEPLMRTLLTRMLQELIDADAVCLSRRDLLQVPDQRPGGVPGRGDRHQRHQRRPPRGTGLRAVGDSETEEFWTEFLSSLRERGLHGVQLVISDAHAGLKAAIAAALQGSAWQRCWVHFMRNVLAKAGKEGEMVASWIRAIFTMTKPDLVRGQLDHVASILAESHPGVVTMLTDAKADLTGSLTSPKPTGARSGPTTPSSDSTRK